MSDTVKLNVKSGGKKGGNWAPNPLETVRPSAVDRQATHRKKPWGRSSWKDADAQERLSNVTRSSFTESFDADGRARAKKCQDITYSVVLLAVCVTFVLALTLESKVARGGMCLLMMGIIWVTELVKLELAGLVPIFLYPAAGIVKAKVVAGKFWNGTSFLFCVGFLMGIVLERWNMHKRISMNMVLLAGNNVSLLLFMMMLAVYLLSMWISNTATILCMLPVVKSFLATVPEKHRPFKGAMLLAVGWSATIGGMSTPVGTPTNTLFLGIYEENWATNESFGFGPFMAFAIPLSFMLLVTAWVLVCVWHVWTAKEKIEVNLDVFREVKKDIGKMRCEEYVVTIYMLILIVFWVFQKDLKKAFNLNMMNTGAVGMLFTFPLFFIPTINKKLELSKNGKDMVPVKHILEWSYVLPRFKWQILFIFGGGYMAAFGTLESGFAKHLASQITPMPEFSLAVLVIFVICFLTEVISNMACVQIFGPILITIAGQMCYSPLKFLLIVCFASSFAFMMPMAGGPNMMVFGTGEDFDLKFMAKHGFALNILACLIGMIYLNFVMPLILSPDQYGPPLQFADNAGPNATVLCP